MKRMNASFGVDVWPPEFVGFNISFSRAVRRTKEMKELSVPKCSNRCAPLTRAVIADVVDKVARDSVGLCLQCVKEDLLNLEPPCLIAEHARLRFLAK